MDRTLTPLQAAAAFAVEHGVRADRIGVLNDGSNLLVHLAPSPIVLRIATFTGRVRHESWPYLEREVALVSWLATAGAAVMPPSDLVPPGPHVVGGWAMSAWRYVEHERGAVPDAATAFHSLKDLHAIMRDYPGTLPLLNPVSDDLDRALRFCHDTGILGADDVAELTTRRNALRADLLRLAPDVQALHGDAFSRNALVTAAGIVWIDFEDCCSGPALWDLATLIRRDPDPVARAEIARRHGAEALDTAIALRQVQANVWIALHDARQARAW